MDIWAVIKTGGKQYQVAEGDQVEVEKLPAKDGEIIFDQVLLIKNGEDLTVGQPFVEKAKVKAKVLADFKANKIRVVKFKSKSRYLRTQGHRQNLTRVQIGKIIS